MPVPDAAVATPVALLLQVPPATVPVSVVLDPAHMFIGPLSGPGTGFTESVCVT